MEWKVEYGKNCGREYGMEYEFPHSPFLSLLFAKCYQLNSMVTLIVEKLKCHIWDSNPQTSRHNNNQQIHVGEKFQSTRRP